MRRFLVPLVLIAAVLAGMGLWLTSGTTPGEIARAVVSGDDAPGTDAAARKRARPAESEARRGRSLDGFVRDGASPAADCAVEVVPLREAPRAAGTLTSFEASVGPASEPPPSWTGVTGSDGTFRATGLASGRFRVTARSTDGRAAARVVEDGDAGPLRLDLPAPGNALHGRVEDADGRPVAARVALIEEDPGSWNPERFPRLAWTPTAADGTFVFGGIRVPRVAVVVSANGLVQTTDPVAIPREDPLVVRVGDVPMRRGVVRDAATRAPIAGARVVWSTRAADGSRYLAGSAATGADGAFQAAVREFTMGVVSAPGWSVERWSGRSASGALIVELTRLAAVEGRVVAAGTGEPVVGATVWFADGRPARMMPAVAATTGTDGAFRAEGVLAADTAVCVLGGGWATPGLERLGPFALIGLRHSAATGPDGALVLTAEPTARIEGRVLGPDGGPVGGANVEAWTGNVAYLSQGARPPHAVTDGDGRFILSDVIPEVAYDVRANSDGLVEEHVSGVGARSGEAVRTEIRFVDCWTVNVQVVAADDGAPVRGAQVMGGTRAPEGHSTSYGPWIVTDGEGRARLGPLPRGAFGVFVRAAGVVESQEPWWTEPQTHGGATSAIVRVPRGEVLAGRIVLPEGVTLRAVEVRAVEVLTGSEFEVDGNADTFRFDTLPHGAFEVTVEVADAQGGHWEANARADSGTTDLALTLALDAVEAKEPRRTMRLRVLDAGGAPVASADVSVSATWGGNSHGLIGCAQDGVAELFFDARATRVVVEVRRARDLQSRPLPCGSLRAELADPRAAEAEVRLPPPQSIDGRVVDADGRGVGGIHVFCISDDGRGAARGPGEAEADVWSGPDGTLHVPNLGEGRYWLVCPALEGKAQPAPVLAESGSAGAIIVLPHIERFRVTVTDFDGKPVSGALVDCLRMSSWDSAGSGRTTGTGLAVLEGIDPASQHRLTVVPPSSRHDFLQAIVERWTPADTTIALRRAGTVTGVVRDARGRPVPGATVVASDTAAGIRRDAGTDETGRFIVRGLPYGLAVRLEAFVGDEVRAFAQAKADDSAVDLVADLGASLRIRVLNAEIREEIGRFCLIGPDGRSEWVDAGPGGVAVAAGLAPDAVFRVRAGPTEIGRWAGADGVVPDGREIELTLREGATIAGRIEPPVGSVLKPDSFIGIASQDGFEVQFDTEPDGRFRLRGLPPGRWRLRVDVEAKGGARLTCVTEVAAGDLDVKMTLAPER